MEFKSLILLIFCVFTVCGSRFEVKADDGKYKSALIGNKECGRGPVYWCDSLQNAVNCSAVAHCTQTVWETQYSTVNSEKCSTCVDSLYNVRSAIKAKSQQYVVWELLRDMCEVASKRSNSQNTNCHFAAKRMFVNAYNHFKTLILNPNIADDILCKINGFCIEDVEEPVESENCKDLQEACIDFNSAVECNTVAECMKHIWKPVETTETVAGPECTLCDNMVKRIQHYISTNDTEAAVRTSVEKICTLPLVSQNYQMCLKWVDKNMVQLLQLLNSTYTPVTICTLLGFCFLKANDKVVVTVNNIELVVPNFLNNENDQFLENPQQSKKNELVGGSECTWGPSYWCTNVTTSAKCHATTHCIQSVWSTQKFEEDNDDVCQICKDMVKQARDTLQSNVTQEELKQVLEGSCKLMIVKPIVRSCIDVVDDFIPQLTQTLVSMLNPNAVCSVAGLCNNREIDQLLSRQQELVKYKNHKVCKHCNTFIAFLKEKFNHSTREDVHRKFIQVCGELSSYSDACTSVVSNNFDVIYDRLLNEFEPYKVCHLTGMCAYKFHFHPTSLNDTGDLAEDSTDVDFATDDIDKDKDLPCDLCKQLADHLREELVSNTTKDEFHQILVGICGQTRKFKDECVDFVDKNFEIIYDYLIEEFNSTVLCTDIGICKRSGNYVTDGKNNLVNGRLITNGILNGVELGSILALKKSPECTLCEYVLHFIQQELHNPKEQTDIKNAVEKVCRYFPLKTKKECDDFIEQYGSLIIALISEEVDPSLVCPELKICPPSAKSVREISSSIAKIEGHLKPSCPVCLLVLDGVFKELRDNKTEKNIENVLRKFCYRLPRSFGDDCDTFINKFYEDIIDMITADFSPEEACTFLHLCSSSEDFAQYKTRVDTIFTATAVPEEFMNEIPTEPMQKIDYVDDDVVIKKSQYTKNCLLCETLLKHFETELTSNITEAKLEELLNDFCDHLKGQLKGECNVLVDKYSDRIFELIVAKVNTTDICTVLKLCPYQKEYSEMKSRCQFCEAVIGSLNGILADPYLDYQIVEYVDKVCDIFPKKRGPLCSEIMSQVIPTLESIAHQIPPWFICTKIKFCPYNIDSPLVSNSMGGSPCTWGPAYWCQSKTTAAMCQTTEHCQMYVWKGVNPPEK